MDNLNAAFPVSALLTGVFTMLIGGMIYTAKAWITKVEARLDKHDERHDRHNDRLIVLEEAEKYRHK